MFCVGTQPGQRALRMVELRTQELHAREQELRGTHGQLRGVLNAATQVAIIATDLRGVINTFNPGAEQMLAASLQRVLALVDHHADLQHDAAVREVAEALADARHRIGFARLAYNDQVQAFNDATAQFPTVVLARVFGFFPLEPLVALP